VLQRGPGSADPARDVARDDRAGRRGGTLGPHRPRAHRSGTLAAALQPAGADRTLTACRELPVPPVLAGAARPALGTVTREPDRSLDRLAVRGRRARTVLLRALRPSDRRRG